MAAAVLGTDRRQRPSRHRPGLLQAIIAQTELILEPEPPQREKAAFQRLSTDRKPCYTGQGPRTCEPGEDYKGQNSGPGRGQDPERAYLHVESAIDLSVDLLLLAVHTLGVDPEQDVNAVPSTLGNLGGRHAGVEPERHRRMAEVVRPSREATWAEVRASFRASCQT